MKASLFTMRKTEREPVDYLSEERLTVSRGSRALILAA
jgi:hypothetical protein